MKELGALMNYRESVKVLDATLRDGGLVNEFRFTDEFVRDLYDTNVKAGVDYMELGYKASKELFDVNKFGPCKFCDEDYLTKMFADKKGDVKLGVMADVGRCDYKNDIVNRSESVLDFVRVATYLHTIPAAIDMIEDAKNKGYEVTCNIMAISNGQESDLKEALDMLGKSPVDVFYIVDSYGSIYPEELARLVDIFNEFSSKYGKKLGIHAHNNQQLAFANTIEAVGDGVDYLDATYGCMGRGAGNCSMELLLGFLKNPKYNVFPAVSFIEKHINKLKEEGIVWGYDLQYMLTGLLNQHPRTAIDFTNKKRKDYTEFYKEVVALD